LKIYPNGDIIMSEYEVKFYQFRSGKSCYDVLLEDIQKNERAEIVSRLIMVENDGFKALGCQFRQIDKKLWEIKFNTRAGSWRFFYTFLFPNIFLILHIYKKKSQKAPVKEIELARKRLAEVLR
jgi:phage-related protein